SRRAFARTRRGEAGRRVVLGAATLSGRSVGGVQMSEVFGQQTPADIADDYNAQVFVIRSLLAKLQTVTLVKVIAVSNAGGVAPVGTVDVQPLVNQMTGDRTAVPHGTIYGVPYFRLQGGADAVILDPHVGDIGMCAFASRDISAVKVAKGVAN